MPELDCLHIPSGIQYYPVEIPGFGGGLDQSIHAALTLLDNIGGIVFPSHHKSDELSASLSIAVHNLIRVFGDIENRVHADFSLEVRLLVSLTVRMALPRDPAYHMLAFLVAESVVVKVSGGQHSKRRRWRTARSCH